MTLKDRTQLLIQCAKNLDLQKTQLQLCKNDIIHWANTFCWTMDPRKTDCSNIPLQLYPYQAWFLKELVHCMEQKVDMGIEKSRDMGLSWCLMLGFQWAWLFKPGWDFHVGSRREAEVDDGTLNPSTLFGKFRYNLYKLPLWMQPDKMAKYDKKLLIRNPINGNILSGESANPAFGIGPRKRAILLDEFSRWENADTIYEGLAQSTPCRIINGTPYGESNAYAKQMRDPKNLYIPFSNEK
jgi:hypothetical protein